MRSSGGSRLLAVTPGTACALRIECRSMSSAKRSITTQRTKPLGPLGAVWEILKKDIRIERRTGEIVATAGVFAIVIGFLSSMAFHVNEQTNAATAAGTIWITIFFATVLSFGRVWQRERDESALTGLLVAPIPRASIFVGKALATFGMIVVIEIPLIFLCMFLFHIDFRSGVGLETMTRDEFLVAKDTAATHAGAFVALVMMGTAALSFVGTLFGAMTVRSRARDLVLAIVLFPLLSPVLICGVVGTRKAFELQAFDAYSGFLGLMATSVVIALLLGVGLFGPLVDD